MKNVILFFVGICLLNVSCKKIEKLTQFNMEFKETITIPSTTGINLPFTILTPDINSNSESTFGSNNTRKDLIEKISLSKMEMKVTNPSSGNFKFLKSIEVYISAEGLNEEKIAFKNNIPADIGNVLTLETSGADIKEFIKKDKYKLRLNTTTREIISTDHQIEILSVFFVDAKIFGQ